MHLRQLILVLSSAAFPVISWASAGPHSDQSSNLPLPTCSQLPDDRDAGGPRHSHYYLCGLSNGVQALDANSTPPRIDAEHPFYVDWEHYPEESKIKREEGSCVVSFTVRADGHIDRGGTRLERSSGSVLLDFECLRAFSDGQVFPAKLHGRPVSRRVGAVVVWAIDGPVPVRPKEQQVVNLCTHDIAPFPASTAAPVDGTALLAATKLATDKGWLLDPCFYRDDALKQFFGATRIDRYFDQASGKISGRSEGIDLVVPGSVFGHSGPGIVSVVLNLVFLPSGIQKAELRVDDINHVMTPAVLEDVVKLYGAGKSGIDETTDGGPTFGTLDYDSVQAELHSHALFVLDGNLLNDIIITTGLVNSTTGYPLPLAPVTPPPVTFKPLPTEPPPGDLQYIVTDLDVFNDAPGKSEYLARLQQQMHALDCCATDIPKLFSGYRLQVRGYQLAPFLPPPDQALIDKVASDENPPVLAINRHNEAVGAYSRAHSDVSQGYLVRDGKLTDLGTLGGRRSQANAINNCGQVAGASELMFDSGEDVFVYQGGVMKDLGPGHANAISDTGLVAGQHWFDGAPQRAALWERGKPIKLCDGLSEAFGVNSVGSVVGECYDDEDNDQTHAFLYQHGKRIDLHDYIVHPRRPGVRTAESIGAGINDAGQIIAYEYEIPRSDPQDEIFYLLTPVTRDSRARAQQSITLQDRDLWLSRCNRLADLRGISTDDRQKFLDWCTEGAALPYLKQGLSAGRRASTSCISINEIVPANIKDAEIPYRVRIPVSAEQLVQALAKLATVAHPQDAAHQLAQRLGVSWRRKREGDQVWWELPADAQWKVGMRLSSGSGPDEGWYLSAGGRFDHDQLVFRESGKVQCLRIDTVDRILKGRGFDRIDMDVPLAGPSIVWRLNGAGTSFIIQGSPKDACLPALMVHRKGPATSS
jgi:TonB family protein